MQTDPNPANFFYNSVTGDLVLIDFGACNRYSKEFVEKYRRVVIAGA